MNHINRIHGGVTKVDHYYRISLWVPHHGNFIWSGYSVWCNRVINVDDIRYQWSTAWGLRVGHAVSLCQLEGTVTANKMFDGSFQKCIS